MAGSKPHRRFAPISQGAAGATEIVAGAPGKTVVLTNYLVVMDTAGTYLWRSGDSTPVSGAIPVDALSGAVCPTDDGGWLQTAPGESLWLVTTGGKAAGHIAYEVDYL